MPHMYFLQLECGSSWKWTGEPPRREAIRLPTGRQLACSLGGQHLSHVNEGWWLLLRLMSPPVFLENGLDVANLYIKGVLKVY